MQFLCLQLNLFLYLVSKHLIILWSSWSPSVHFKQHFDTMRASENRLLKSDNEELCSRDIFNVCSSWFCPFSKKIGWMDGAWLCLWTIFYTKLGRAWGDGGWESGCSLLQLLVLRINFPQRRCFSRNLIWVKNGNPAVRLTEPNQNMVFFQRKNMRRPSSSAHQWLLSGGWALHRVVITTFLCVCVHACVLHWR